MTLRSYRDCYQGEEGRGGEERGGEGRGGEEMGCGHA